MSSHRRNFHTDVSQSWWRAQIRSRKVNNIVKFYTLHLDIWNKECRQSHWIELNRTWDHWTSVLPTHGRMQPLKNTGVWLWTRLCSRRVCHEETDRKRITLTVSLFAVSSQTCIDQVNSSSESNLVRTWLTTNAVLVVNSWVQHCQWLTDILQILTNHRHQTCNINISAAKTVLLLHFQITLVKII